MSNLISHFCTVVVPLKFDMIWCLFIEPFSMPVFTSHLRLFHDQEIAPVRFNGIDLTRASLAQSNRS